MANATADVNGQKPISAVELHAQGVEQMQRGEYRSAVDLLGQAVASRPTIPAFHIDLAEAYRKLGEFDRAAGCCRIALKLRPDYPEGLNTLGLTIQDMGRLEEAVAHFQRALTIRPEMVAAHNNLGVVLRELGRDDEAIEHFRSAVALEPAIFRLRTNLGLALLDQGRADEALEQLKEAARLQPDLAVLHHNLGNALRVLNRNEEARAAYLEAMRLDTERAENYFYVGMTFKGEGQLGNAVSWLKLATEQEPQNAAYWEERAGVHAEREEHNEAIACWEQVLALAPEKQASAHNSLGWALQEEGRLAEAREHYQAALRLQPDLAPALLHLGGIHEELGAMAEAEAAFRAALRAQPNFPMPHARLATLLREKLPDPDLNALERRLADPRLPEHPRARLLFGLAHVLDARGDYHRAGDCLREANALTRQETKGEREYVPADHERFVDGLLSAFDAGFFQRTAGMGHESRRPVFVFGLPRSGTTLTEQVIASHPLVHGAGELRFSRQSFESIPSVLARSEPPVECVPHLEAGVIQRLAEEHLAKLAALDGGRAERIVNKMPENYLYLGLLVTLFPNATFIHCRRDLRDVAVSCWMTDFRSIRWANDQANIASRFWEYRRLTDHWRAVLPGRVIDVDYADTISDLEGVARRVLAACGLDWDPACLEFYRTQRRVRTASIVQVRQPIYTKSLDRWKNYENELGALFTALGDTEAESGDVSNRLVGDATDERIGFTG